MDLDNVVVVGGGFVEVQMGDFFRKTTLKKGQRLVKAEHVFNVNEAFTAFGAELTGTVPTSNISAMVNKALVINSLPHV